ncbi:WD repeat-containing protein 26 [Rhynchospora pubera]|uniref:WD repeat-containing protein 26 n=1 Tax=Rhynchospora pubera TaxID=906938 RepID=A0AAV8F1F1_9POAL|nr:WD repeat-containing protein 26 [Rhynchospora pubera]
MESSDDIESRLSRLGSRGLIDTTQFVRIIIQSLYSLGFNRAASSLESESGVRLDSAQHDRLLFDVMSGRWESCVSTINSIPGIDSSSLINASYLIWKEHFFELIGSGCFLPAIEVLWKQISPLGVDSCRVHRLAQYLVCYEAMGQTGSMGSTVQRRISLFLDLVEVLPPYIRVPSGRLEKLVETAVLKQRSSCQYHNLPKDITLFEDHKCWPEQIPSTCSQVLLEHKNEVWFVQFSHNGRYLASSSSDCTAIIWTVEDDDMVVYKHCLMGHEKPISFLSWSPDDTMLITCGNGETSKLWDVKTSTLLATFSDPKRRIISSCAWFPSSDKVLCASSEPDNRIFTCDLAGNVLDAWEGERIPKISDLAISSDGRLVIGICSEKTIWLCEFPQGKEKVIREERSITSLSLSRDGQFFIVNLNSEEIHLRKLDVNIGDGVDAVFKGHRQGKYVIRSCFGGSGCSFVASGSEDSKIYIWRRKCESPIKVLMGHSMIVNSVTWNPARPHMLASASDDHTVRIWMAGCNPQPSKKLGESLIS